MAVTSHSEYQAFEKASVTEGLIFSLILSYLN